ncbi:phage portal protein [Methylobacterium nodulans]|uniref:Phage portal protein, HK97 family n=1 Tax=Methylobacterium nodulans (strain LMG 21967 / CNCM I-2342 / ORS 2060) TaxID=460265 RepID=B8IT97_METNO|nr:phage portal protein [Methylobacterium nodulans]ACL56983.1 phage portal protein, HK97 family [Methylobacterium nodulans ORS 2060]
MGLLASLFGAAAAPRFGPSASVSDGGWLIRAIGGGRTAAGTVVTEHSALRLPVVYACVNRISNPLARFPIKIMKPRAGGGSEEVTDHPLSRRLGLRPNDFMSSRTLRKTAQAHALLWGNGYMEIERNGRGQAVGLWPLLPWATQPVREDGVLVYRTTIDGQTFRLDHEDVLHIMDLSQDGYVGHSPVALAREALGLAQALEQFGGKFFANDAKSGGFLLHPGRLSAGAQANLRAQGPRGQRDPNAPRVEPGRTDPGAMLERQGGLDNAHRVKVLEEGMKYIQTTIPPEDAQFLGTREMQIAEIARMYDVPLILLQSHEKTTSWGSGIEQLMIGFVRQTVEPWVNAWEQEMNWKLFTEEERKQGYFVKFNMNALLRGDMMSRARFYQLLFGVGGLSPNDILTLEDMDPLGPEGDHHFVPVNMHTLKNAIDTVGVPQGGAVPPDPTQEARLAAVEGRVDELDVIAARLDALERAA